MPGDPLLLLLLAVGGLAGLWVVERTIARDAVGWTLVALVVLLPAAGIELEPGVLGFRLDPRDAVMVVLAVAALARFLRGHPLTGGPLLLLVFVALSVLAIGAGAGVHGLASAVNEGRKFLYVGVAALYASTTDVRGSRREGPVRVWLWLAVALLAVAVVEWAAFATGVAFLPTGVPDDLRVIDSFETLVVLQAVLLAAGALLSLRSDRTLPTDLDDVATHRLELLVAAGGVAVVLLQHRTLWIGLLLGVVLLVAREPTLGSRLLARVTVGAVLVGVLAFALLGQGTDRVEIVADLERSAQDVDTFEWRLEGWGRLLADQAPDGPAELLVGQRFGGGFQRYVDGGIVDVSPHNFPLESFLRVGLVGALVFVGLHVWVVATLLRSRGGTALVRDDVLAVVLALAMLYYLTSHPGIEQGLLLGLGVAVASERAASRGRARQPNMSRTAG
ncbi:MAG: hypothetical protein ACLGIR_10565 [Actinomycetes bacterium]